MRKRIVLLVALCATTMSLAACHNTETTNTEVTGTPVVQEEVKTDKEDKTPSKNDATVEPTTAPSADTTVEPTVAPTEAPAEPKEVSWEESGMSYELFENPDGTVAVIVTNNSDTTYYCDSVYYFELETNGKWYQFFDSMPEAENFVNTITTSPFVTQTRENCFTVELPCTITGDNSTDEYYTEYSYKAYYFKSDNALETFNKMTNLTLTKDEYYNSFMAFNCTPSYGIVILYDENNEIVAITKASIEPIDNSRTEFTGGIAIDKNFAFSKMTMLMQYCWIN